MTTMSKRQRRRRRRRRSSEASKDICAARTPSVTNATLATSCGAAARGPLDCEPELLSVMRNKFTQQGSDVQGGEEDDGEVDRSQGATRAISSYIDPGLCWDDVPWIKSITNMKVLLKGVQCGEDAVMAYHAGLAGCVLSNHGGRQLDTCRSGIEVLPEVMDALKAAGCKKEEFSVFVDGGIRRGGDIFKAIALGASGIGVGRPVLYSLASYGEKGVVRMVHMLQDELTMVMRLSGCPTVASITNEHVITRNLADHIVPLPADHLTMGTYMPLLPAARM
mmetsp:Transcript_134205/g.428847  ORF Transcript_134205/g.428847 Transcript_134205/m.428847 type:complete len:279 (-) Transcript_134205:400-1236(-)